MELQNEFTLPGEPDEVFELLLDLEQVVGCVPGAILSRRDEDACHGKLRLKVEPAPAAYEGSVVIAEEDRASRAATFKASGREPDGEGTGEVTIRATVQGNGTQSRVAVTSHVEVQGREPRHGVVGEVSQRLVNQIAANLEARLVAARDAPGAALPGTTPAAPTQPAESAALPSGAPWNAALTLAAVVLGLVVGWLIRGQRKPIPKDET